MKLHRRDSFFLLLAALVLGATTDVLARQQIIGLNFVIWSGLWLLLLLSASYHKKKLNARSIVYSAFIIMNAALVYIRSEPVVQVWSVLTTLVFLAIFSLYILLDNHSETSLFNRVLELISGGLTSFLTLLAAMTRSFVGKTTKSDAPKRPLSAGILIAIPLVVIFIALFSSSDAVFRNNFSWLGRWATSFGDALSNLLRDLNVGRGIVILFWSVLSLAGLALLVRTNYISRLSIYRLPAKMQPKDVAIVLGSVVAVFALFIVIQLRYLFTSGMLPNGLTYADYARRGYGELLLATLLASMVIYLLGALKNKKTRSTEILSYTLLGLNLLVVLSAWKRLSLYESAYGWTMTRFVARMGLVSILVGICSLGVWLLGKFNTKQLYSFNWYALAIVLTIAAVINPIGIITTKNIVDRDKREVALDTNHIIRQSADSYPAICAHAALLKATHLKEYEYLADRKEVFTTYEGQEIVTSERPNENAPDETSQGLSAHYTKSRQYIDKYKYCLQK